MWKDDAVAYFGNQQKVADCVGLVRTAVTMWPDLIPEKYAWMIQGKTGGELKVDPSLYDSKT